MSFTIPAILAILFLACSVVHVYARYTGRKKTGIYTKPLLMPLLLATFLTATSAAGGTIPRIWLLAVTLILYTIGDICLLFPASVSPKLFFIGMGSFMAGHTCYMMWFLTFVGWGSLHWLAMAVVAVLLMVTLVPFCRKVLASKAPQAPVLTSYGILMGVFAVCVASSWNSGPIIGTILALAGVAVYSLSDSLIAMNRIGDDTVPNDAAIMTTYLLANVLLLCGVWILTRTPTTYVLL